MQRLKKLATPQSREIDVDLLVKEVYYKFPKTMERLRKAEQDEDSAS